MSAFPAPSPAAKPNRMTVSLQIGGFFFALANIICVAILAWTYLSVKLEPKSLEVKGSAKKAIVSDRISWTATITARDPDLIKAYDKLKTDTDHVAAFLKETNVPAKDITFSSINTEKIYQKQVIPAVATNSSGGILSPPLGSVTAVASTPPGPTIIQTNTIEFYVLVQTVTIESQDMTLVPEVSRSITTLIKDGVEIDSGSPQYLYTKLSELKINMLADATKDATTRASQIVNNAHGSLGKLVEAKMGVMQINPKGSSATSSEGNNDTTSFEKEITAIVTVRFELQ